MVSYREGDWIITSPIYVGTQAQVTEAQTCQHEFADILPQPNPTSDEDTTTTMLMQKCNKCVASRMKYKEA